MTDQIPFKRDVTPALRAEVHGLREAHAHIAQHGRAMSMVRLEHCASVDDLLQRIATAGADTDQSPAMWLLGVGLRIEAWSDPRWPTATELDTVTGPRPACLWSFDHHALLVNTAGMNALGITRESPDPENGRIVRDEQNGEPTGLMLEAAAKMVWNSIPEPSASERRRQVLAAVMDLASHGFTEVHDLVAQRWLGPMLAELDSAGELPLRVILYPLFPDLDAVLASRAGWERDTVRLGGAKLFADGTLNSRTAWMLHEYVDPLPGLPRGQGMLRPAELRDAMARLWSEGLGLAVHAIGDGAVRAVLDAGQEAGVERHTGPLPALRIEHAELIDEADVARFASLGVIASVQPCHLLTDIEVLRRILPHRLDRVLPLRELIDAGCAPGELLWFGSDTPIVRPHPQDSIQAAVGRRRAEMAPGDAVAPEQAISEAEAWLAFRCVSGREQSSNAASITGW
jgi:predicted amidohydrolase YtcJ